MLLTFKFTDQTSTLLKFDLPTFKWFLIQFKESWIISNIEVEVSLFFVYAIWFKYVVTSDKLSILFGNRKKKVYRILLMYTNMKKIFLEQRNLMRTVCLIYLIYIHLIYKTIIFMQK